MQSANQDYKNKEPTNQAHKDRQLVSLPLTARWFKACFYLAMCVLSDFETGKELLDMFNWGTASSYCFQDLYTLRWEECVHEIDTGACVFVHVCLNFKGKKAWMS